LEKAVAGMKVEDQAAAVAARLKLLNPRVLENSIRHRVENGVVVYVEVIDASDLANLAPLRRSLASRTSISPATFATLRTLVGSRG